MIGPSGKMEAPKEQKPIPLDYATPSPWVEWRVSRRIILGIGLTVLWWVMFCGTVVVANLDLHIQVLKIPAMLVMFPLGWFIWRTHFEGAIMLLLANSLLWGFGLAFLLHRRMRRRQ